MRMLVALVKDAVAVLRDQNYGHNKGKAMIKDDEYIIGAWATAPTGKMTSPVIMAAIYNPDTREDRIEIIVEKDITPDMRRLFDISAATNLAMVAAVKGALK